MPGVWSIVYLIVLPSDRTNVVPFGLLSPMNQVVMSL